MKEISNDDLLDELKRRFVENKKMFHDLLVMTRKFEELNERLRLAESHKSSFLSHMRNELNSPLAVIMDISSELGKSLLNPETVAHAARTIYNEAFELNFQLDNIFVAAELEAGESKLEISRIDVVQLIRDLVSSFRHRITAKKLDVEFTFDPVSQDEKIRFSTDAPKLSCMLANLLDNAIKYNNDGESILIFAEKKDDRLRISFSDDGSGIAEKDRRKVFERFAQIDTGPHKRHKGYGLGLSITKALAEMLDGSVTVTSPYGRGCVFTLTVNETDGRVGESALFEGQDTSLLDDAQKY